MAADRKVSVILEAKDLVSAPLRQIQGRVRDWSQHIVDGLNHATRSGAVRWQEGLAKIAEANRAAAAATNTTTAATLRATEAATRFQLTLNRGASASKDFGEAGGRGFGRVQNILFDLSREVVGVDSKIGKLFQTLGSFAIGGGFLTAIAAGFAVVVGWLREMGRESREAEERTRELVKTLNEAADQRDGTAQRNDLGTLRARRDALRTELQGLLDNPFAQALGTGKSREAQIRKDLADVERALEELMRQGAAATELPELEGTVSTGETAIQRGMRHPFAGDRNGGRPEVQNTAGLVPEKPELRLDPTLPEGLPVVANAATQMAEGFSLAREALDGLTVGFAQFGDAAAAGFADAIAGGANLRKTLGRAARTQGMYDLTAAFSALGRGLFGDPAALAAAPRLFASSAKWFALSGLLGGGGGGSGGGGASGRAGGSDALSGDGFTRNQRALAKAREAPATLVLKRGAYIRPDDPDFIDFLNQARKLGGDRDVEVTFG
jgi:hypothetical protein